MTVIILTTCAVLILTVFFAAPMGATQPSINLRCTQVPMCCAVDVYMQMILTHTEGKSQFLVDKVVKAHKRGRGN
jgi:hypothetical protein